MGPVQRNAAAAAVFDSARAPQAAASAVHALVTGFVDWYLLGLAVLVVFTLAAAAGATAVRTLLVLRRQSRETGGDAPLTRNWADCAPAARPVAGVGLAGSGVAWAAAGAR